MIALPNPFPMITTTELPTVSYFIGDLGCVLSDEEWDVACYRLTKEDPTSEDYDPEFHLDPANYSIYKPNSGKPCYLFATKYGDGLYQDDAGRNYAVDSGTIGAIKPEFISNQEEMKRLLDAGYAHIVDFPDDDLNIGCSDGVIYFDEFLTIDTN